MFAGHFLEEHLWGTASENKLLKQSSVNSTNTSKCKIDKTILTNFKV